MQRVGNAEAEAFGDSEVKEFLKVVVAAPAPKIKTGHAVLLQGSKTGKEASIIMCSCAPFQA